MKKKGDISIQVIVIAILALLVLVLLSVIFISKTSQWEDNVSSCLSRGGTCDLGPVSEEVSSGDRCHARPQAARRVPVGNPGGLQAGNAGTRAHLRG